MEILDLAKTIMHVLLVFIGVLTVILIARIYKLYMIMKIHKTVMSPMLVAGIFIALMGVTELIEPYIKEVGHVVHALTMLLTAVSFTYGIYSYYKMLQKTAK